MALPRYMPPSHRRRLASRLTLTIKDVYLPSSIAQISFITFLCNPLSLLILCRALDKARLKHNPWSERSRSTKNPNPPLISSILSKRNQSVSKCQSTICQCVTHMALMDFLATFTYTAQGYNAAHLFSHCTATACPWQQRPVMGLLGCPLK